MNDFTMSKFASKEHMIAAMRERIEKLELENAELRVEIEYYADRAPEDAVDRTTS